MSKVLGITSCLTKSYSYEKNTSGNICYVFWYPVFPKKI